MLHLLSICRDAAKSTLVVISSCGVICACHDILRILVVLIGLLSRGLYEKLMDMMVSWFIGGQAQVLAVARPNFTYVEKKVESTQDFPLIPKVQKPKKSESDVKAEQAEWIKRYMSQQAEVISVRILDLQWSHDNW